MGGFISLDIESTFFMYEDPYGVYVNNGDRIRWDTDGMDQAAFKLCLDVDGALPPPGKSVGASKYMCLFLTSSNHRQVAATLSSF